MFLGGDVYSRADAGAVGFCADGADLDPVAVERWSRSGELGHGVDAVDDYVEVAVVVVVSEGAAAGGDGSGHAGAGLAGDLFELAVAQVAIEVFVLGVGRIDVRAVHFGIDVAVGDEDVEPAVVVHVEEADAPAEVAGVDAEAGEVGVVVEVAAAEVQIEGVGVAGEVGLDDVEEAVAVEVSDGNAHAGLGLAVGRVGDAGLDGDVFEGAVLLVLVEGGGGGVVGDVDVGPAIVVEVGDADAEAIGADGVEDARFFGDVGEGAVAIVVVEDVFTTLQAGWAAGDLNAFVGAAGGFGVGRGLDVEVDVVGDEEVEMAVAVVVEEGAAGVPTGGGLEEAGFGGDVGEGAVAVVAVEDVLAVVGDEEVVPAVVVVVADAAALSPAAAGEAGFSGDVGEGAVAVVLEEMAVLAPGLWGSLRGGCR